MYCSQPSADKIGSRSVIVDDRVNLKWSGEQAEAVISILAKKQAGAGIAQEDWRRLFDTVPYINLKDRECAMGVGFSDDEFKQFVLLPEVAQRAAEFERTLTEFKKIDLARLAGRVLEYLPVEARISAKIFLVIKPKINSFVYDSTDGPAVFIYVDPRMTGLQFENLVAHELHHIGLFDVGSKHWKYTDLLPHVRSAVNWMGAFGEGLAMLAAAGGPDIHPHLVSQPADRARWDRDMANFNSDMKCLDKFFRDIVEHRLVGNDIDTAGYAFYGVQGPWYTVGWKMAAVVEGHYGRETLIKSMLDSRLLLVRYNDAIRQANGDASAQPLWSSSLISEIF